MLSCIEFYIGYDHMDVVLSYFGSGDHLDLTLYWIWLSITCILL